MSDKTELPKEWQQEAEKKYPVSDSQHPSVLEHNTNQQHKQSVFTEGAKAYRDEVEKMLNDKIVLAYVKSNLESDLKGSYLQQSTYYQELLTELQTLTPTQDGK